MRRIASGAWRDAPGEFLKVGDWTEKRETVMFLRNGKIIIIIIIIIIITTTTTTTTTKVKADKVSKKDREKTDPLSRQE
jgi:hypothetical protein